jgi:threonine synthase
MESEILLACVWCGREASVDQTVRACISCAGSLEVEYDYEKIRNQFHGTLPSVKGAEGIWRFAPLLPLLSPAKAVSLGEGSTPYHRIQKIGSSLSMSGVFVKDESRNPTCSFKDRKSAVAISKAIEDGFNKVVAATAGNAGSSVAAYATKADIESYIFAFQGISRAKLAKLLAYKANVFLTSASTGDVLEFTTKVCNAYKLQNCSAASRYNPFVKEGAKTSVFEIYEQTNGQLPDWIILPVGGGGNISSYFKGLKELKELGLIEKYPRLVGVQASGCAPVAEAFNKNLDPRNIPKIKNPKTIAHSILDDWAPDGDIAIVSLRETLGLAVTVTEEEIISATQQLSGVEAIYAEPSSATPLAALKNLVSNKVIDKNENVALIVTGFGLNQPDATIDNSPAATNLTDLDVNNFGKYLTK